MCWALQIPRTGRILSIFVGYVHLGLRFDDMIFGESDPLMGIDALVAQPILAVIAVRRSFCIVCTRAGNVFFIIFAIVGCSLLQLNHKLVIY